MKIEKLTENKIRVIIKPIDLGQTDIDLHTIMTKSFENKTFFLDLLSKAEKEVGFNTEGCKLLIEAFSSSDDVLVFTITKYTNPDYNFSCKNNSNEKKFIVKRKSINLENKDAIYKFDNFDIFCNFCVCINNIKDFEVKKLCKNTHLYLYNNIYYLSLSKINTNYIHLRKFYSLISEFAKLHSSSSNFNNKLLEHGQLIIKKDAISTGIKYFC